uniref:IMP cyclohydrolase n=1 Tax=Ruminococcus sp. TaxID=41978 RepID=UPI0025DE1032
LNEINANPKFGEKPVTENSPLVMIEYSSPMGYFIHTYMGDGNPLPSFEGEPTQIDITGDIDNFTKNVWEALNADNKVSLFTRFIDIETGKYESRIVNKNN